MYLFITFIFQVAHARLGTHIETLMERGVKGRKLSHVCPAHVKAELGDR